WDAWEPFLARHGYRPVWFDSLNRYYLADEAAELARHFEDAPPPWPAPYPNAELFRDATPALASAQHGDHGLATLMAKAAMRRLPVPAPALLRALLPADIAASELDRRAEDADLAQACQRLFAGPPTQRDRAEIALDGTVRDLYRRLIDGDRFR